MNTVALRKVKENYPQKNSKAVWRSLILQKTISAKVRRKGAISP